MQTTTPKTQDSSSSMSDRIQLLRNSTAYCSGIDVISSICVKMNAVHFKIMLRGVLIHCWIRYFATAFCYNACFTCDPKLWMQLYVLYETTWTLPCSELFIHSIDSRQYFLFRKHWSMFWKVKMNACSLCCKLLHTIF